MTPAEAGTILRYLAQAFPSATIGDDTPIVWADALTGIDAQDAQTAARQLAKTDNFMPSLARVILAARGIAKAREADRPALPAGKNPTGARILAAIQAASAAVDRPAHDHRHGADTCPCCSTKEQRIQDFTTSTLGVLREAGVIR